MRTWKVMLLAVAAAFLTLTALIDIFQYRNALTTSGTITEVAERCTYRGENLRVNCGMRAVKVSYVDGDIERSVDRTWERGRSYRPAAFVGMKTPVVYVPGNSMRTRFGESRWEVPGLMAWMLFSGVVVLLWIRWLRSRGWEPRGYRWQRRTD
jgi:hypothetical protein